MTLLLAVLAGALIGLALGALGGGGSILAVPVLVHLLGQGVAPAMTGSLVVVGVTSLIAAATAYRAGNVRLGRGIAFGLAATGGAVAGARASVQVADSVLLTAFAALMLLVGGLMGLRQLRLARRRSGTHGDRPDSDIRRPTLDDPIITIRDGFSCDCPRGLKVLVAATGVGLLTGFLGVGGGFLVVPALVVALGLPMVEAAGTSLVVIALTSAVALVVRAGSGAAPDWWPVAVLAVASVAGGVGGARLADRIDAVRLSAAFTVLVLGVAVYTATLEIPGLA